jgi:hypothetical protein
MRVAVVEKQFRPDAGQTMDGIVAALEHQFSVIL